MTGCPEGVPPCPTGAAPKSPPGQPGDPAEHKRRTVRAAARSNQRWRLRAAPAHVSSDSNVSLKCGEMKDLHAAGERTAFGPRFCGSEKTHGMQRRLHSEHGSPPSHLRLSPGSGAHDEHKIGRNRLCGHWRWAARAAQRERAGLANAEAQVPTPDSTTARFRRGPCAYLRRMRLQDSHATMCARRELADSTFIGRIGEKCGAGVSRNP